MSSLSSDNLDISDLLKSVRYDICYVRDRLTFYGFKEDKNMYITSVAGSNNNFTFPRNKILQVFQNFLHLL
jgi:hypothetical protein